MRRFLHIRFEFETKQCNRNYYYDQANFNNYQYSHFKVVAFNNPNNQSATTNNKLANLLQFCKEAFAVNDKAGVSTFADGIFAIASYNFKG